MPKVPKDITRLNTCNMTKIIDSHHHLWQFNEEDYGWMDDSMEILRKDYLPADLEPELKKLGVEGTVVVQARQKIEETEWLLKQAEENDFIKGVVGWVDLRSEELEAQLERFAAHPKLLGVRHVIHDETDDDFIYRPDFQRMIGLLAAHGLTYDLLLFPKHLLMAVDLARKFPEQRFVLDHLSKPLIKYERIEIWNEDIEVIAKLPNVCCKISGMVTEADLDKWKYEDFVPYLDVVVNAFGTDRIMYGSDWPVCRLGGEYDEILDIPKKYFADYSEEDKQKIFRENCIEFYNLNS